MSKRCKLQKEYYKEFGNYKGSGKYTDHYVSWLEIKALAINYTRCCESDSEQLKDKAKITFDEYVENFYICNGFTYESKRTGKLVDVGEITERYRWYSKNL